MGKEDVLAQVNEEIEDMDLDEAIGFLEELIDELQTLKLALEEDRG
jgi:hypothetical protein